MKRGRLLKITRGDVGLISVAHAARLLCPERKKVKSAGNIFWSFLFGGIGPRPVCRGPWLGLGRPGRRTLRQSRSRDRLPGLSAGVWGARLSFGRE